MTRLIKRADDNTEQIDARQMNQANMQQVEEVNILLDRIDEASNNLKDVYYALFDNLNALYQSFPEVYTQLQMVVRLPDNDTANDTISFNTDLHQALQHFKDPQYLSSYLNNNNINDSQPPLG